MMRQAGRYQNSYLELRKKHSFIDLCKIPELAATVAMNAVEEFDFDAAILFSDLLFPLEALGMGLTYDPAPKLSWKLNAETIKKLKSPEEAEAALLFQGEAMKKTREQLPRDKSLLGFVGGPFTLFVYAIEGSHAGSLRETKNLFPIYAEFLKIMTPLLRTNIADQLHSGADVVYLLDTASGELSPENFSSLVLPIIQQLAKEFPGKIAYYTKGVGETQMAPLFLDRHLCCVGVDHRWSLTNTLGLKRNVGIQGNFDPVLLTLPHADFKKEFQDFLIPLLSLSPEQRRGWICGLGHGILPGTPNENVTYFVKTIREQLK
jgi:uroporphyrinogen decarboxylase